MARALRRPDLAVVAAIAAVAAVLYAVAGRRVPGLWIMPDEAIYADRALRLWHHGSLPVFRGAGAGYGLVYPLLAAAPLALGGLGTLKVFDAFVMSLAAVPVFLYGRRLMRARYALTAAALTVASPLLLYSGLVMTEVAFYPLAALALVAIARAVESATLRDQAIALGLVVVAVLTRTQAVVFVAVLAGGAVVDALVARDTTRLRRFWPAFAAVAVGAAVAVAAPGIFGSYSSVVGGGYPVGASLRLSVEHLAYIALATGVLPAASFGVLLVEAARGRERDPAARALLAVTVCAIAGVCVQVGFFAARFAPHLLGRDLAALPPLLFLTFALWLSRGAPRPVWVVAPVCFAVLALLALTPWKSLVNGIALPDSLESALVYRISASVDAATLVTLGGLALLLAFALVPRRADWLLPAVVLALLVATSIAALPVIRARVAADQQQLLGSPRDWIDRAARGSVTYIYDGEAEWPTVWQQRFWNDRIKHVLSFAPAHVPGPMPQTVRAPSPDGRLATDDRYVVAPDRYTFNGTPVTQHRRGVDLATLTLWRLSGPARLELATNGIQPNGDMIGPATIVAYGCAGGTLHLTLLPKATHILTVLLDGKRVLREDIGGRDSWTRAIKVPRSHRDTCRFRLKGGLLLGSTVRSFERA